MCVGNSALLWKAMKVYQQHSSSLFASFSWLWELFVDITCSPEAGEVVCVLDALDECAPNDDGAQGRGKPN